MRRRLSVLSEYIVDRDDSDIRIPSVFRYDSFRISFETRVSLPENRLAPANASGARCSMAREDAHNTKLRKKHANDSLSLSLSRTTPPRKQRKGDAEPSSRKARTPLCRQRRVDRSNFPEKTHALKKKVPERGSWRRAAASVERGGVGAALEQLQDAALVRVLRRAVQRRRAYHLTLSR